MLFVEVHFYCLFFNHRSVKSRLQTKQVMAGDKRQQYKGPLEEILKMIRYEVLYRFYKGMEHKDKCKVFKRLRF
ncbi:hypothetical protein CARUB_v10027478mg [Capsella rubella]|uniref:Uncharacterized protein n=1 Tax=Capsella rubella TaxID=81985 RepID=R0GCC0_9BRAS|nr:hypothetical protein CARUB_v10027478mg [Capsella rubella]